MRRNLGRLCATATLAISLTIGPSFAALTPACASQHSPARIWMGEAISQTFTPPATPIAGFEAKIFFRRAFEGVIDARLQINAPVDPASDDLAARGAEIAKATARAAGNANASTWARFTLPQPIPALALEEALLEIELRPGRDPAWAWLGCASNYRGGRAFGRAALGVAGVTVPNEAAKLTLDGSADLQFRILG